MAFVDYYKILGVDKNIPQNDVRAAYRKRAKQFHPDLHPNDPKAKAKFQALNEAYDVISDPDKRAKYDKYGEQWKNAATSRLAGLEASEALAELEAQQEEILSRASTSAILVRAVVDSAVSSRTCLAVALVAVLEVQALMALVAERNLARRICVKAQEKCR